MTIPAQFFDLRQISSDWRLNCPTHGNVTNIILFDEDFLNGSLCLQCWREDIAKTTKKCTFNSNGGPQPALR